MGRKKSLCKSVGSKESNTTEVPSRSKNNSGKRLRSMNAPVEATQVACSNFKVRTSKLTEEFRDIKLNPRRKLGSDSLADDSLEFVKKGAQRPHNKSTVDVDSYCCSLSSSSSSLSSAVRKRVHFACDNKGRVHCEKHSNYTPRNRKEVQASWYTPSQFMSFRKSCRDEAILISKSSYCKNFAAVYEACNTGNFKLVTKQRAYISAATCRGTCGWPSRIHCCCSPARACWYR